MARSQQETRQIDHETGTASDINAARIEDHLAMARSKPSMGLIDHTAGDVNVIFGGNRGGGVLMGRAIQSTMVG